jgi:hypothetical protein
MTVEELIEKLNQITDKTKQVMFVGMYEDVVIEQVKEQKEEVIVVG